MCKFGCILSIGYEELHIKESVTITIWTTRQDDGWWSLHVDFAMQDT